MMNFRLVIQVGFLALAAAACEPASQVRNPVPTAPLVDQVDDAIAVYYPLALRSFTCVVDKGYIYEKWTIDLGDPSVAMFDNILRAKFRTVELLPANPLEGSAPVSKKSLIIELVSFNGCEARWPVIGRTRMSVAYRARFLRTDGHVVEDITAHGESGPGDGGLAYVGKHLTDLTEAAMRRAAADLVVQMEESESVREWLTGDD
jgi:hypothetical protein